MRQREYIRNEVAYLVFRLKTYFFALKNLFIMVSCLVRSGKNLQHFFFNFQIFDRHFYDFAHFWSFFFEF